MVLWMSPLGSLCIDEAEAAEATEATEAAGAIDETDVEEKEQQDDTEDDDTDGGLHRTTPTDEAAALSCPSAKFDFACDEDHVQSVFRPPQR